MYALKSDILWLIPVLPLVGAIINGVLGHRLRTQTVGAIATLAVAASFGIATSELIKMIQLTPQSRMFEQQLFNWISVGGLHIDARLVLDSLSIILVMVITGVGSLIHLYSTAYIEHDRSPWRYFAYLNLFVFSMLVLVMGSNLATMFVGWEGVGACSYLLIGYWYEKGANADAGKKAFITNRIGDAGFLLGMFLIYSTTKTLEFDQFHHFVTVRNVIPPAGLATAAALLLFVGAMGKSAQIPLHVWLPDAMAGPTPVSALIHAATMVTAGVYMIARMYPLFWHAEAAMQVVAWTGALTALFAASIALVQTDIKKVLAYSTVSQLGFMFVAMGVGAFNAGIFHLLTHAFFKALLFLGAGTVIHAMEHAQAAEDPQDMRTMGGLRQYMPFTYAVFVCGTIAIAGLPLTSGFFSKDEILWSAFSSARGGVGLYAVAALAAFGTAFYMFRLLFMTFHGSFRGSPGSYGGLHDPDWRMKIPLGVLALLALGAGFWGVSPGIGHLVHIPYFVGHWTEGWFGYALSRYETVRGGAVFEYSLMGLSIVLAFAGLFLAKRRYARADFVPQDPTQGSWIGSLLYHKYYVDELWQGLVLKPLRVGSKVLLLRVADQGLINGSIATAGGIVQSLSDILRSSQNGKLGSYLAWMLAGLVALLVWVGAM